MNKTNLPNIATHDLSFMKKTIHITSLYWNSEDKLFAWLAVLAMIALSILGVAMALATNEWYKHFYDAIQASNKEKFYNLILIFLCIAASLIFRSVVITYLIEMLALRWRRWLTNYYTNKWISTPSARNLSRLTDNPDQRIAEDIQKFTYETLDLGCGLIYTLTSVFSFSVVLISISGDLKVGEINIPYYMFWAALTYAIIGTVTSQKIGFKLVALSNKQQRTEADLRFQLIKLRESSAASTAQLGNQHHRRAIGRCLVTVLRNTKQKILLTMKLSCFTQAYTQLSLIFSSLLAMPRFFAKEISFGELMQINSAFGNLYENLSWFINAYPRLAEWKATIDRINLLDHAIALKLDSNHADIYT